MKFEKRIKVLRGYIRQSGFSGIWLSREEVIDLLDYVDKGNPRPPARIRHVDI